MNIRSLLIAGAALVAVGAPLSAANAAERGYDRDSYSRDWRDGRQQDIRFTPGVLRRIDYLQREVAEGRREGWLNYRDANRVSADLRAVRNEVRRASYRFGNRLPWPVAQRFDNRIDQLDLFLTRAEQRNRWHDRDGRWDGRGDRDWGDRDGRNDGGWNDRDGRGDYDRDGLRR